MGAPTYSLLLIAVLWALISWKQVHYVQTIPVSFQEDNSSISSFNTSDPWIENNDKNDEVPQKKHIMKVSMGKDYLQSIWNNLSSTASWNSGVPGLQVQQNLLSDISKYQDTSATSTDEDLWSQYHGTNDLWNITAFNEVWNGTALNDELQKISAKQTVRTTRSNKLLIVLAFKIIAGLIIFYRVRMKRHRKRDDQEMLQQEAAKNSASE